jgi:hypothetical protein
VGVCTVKKNKTKKTKKKQKTTHRKVVVYFANLTDAVHIVNIPNSVIAGNPANRNIAMDIFPVFYFYYYFLMESWNIFRITINLPASVSFVNAICYCTSPQN